MRLYHATWPSRAESIRTTGLRSVMGEVYLANKAHYAAGFVRMRGHEVTGTQEIELNGKVHTLPAIQLWDDIIVFEIDTDGLPDPLIESTDHSSDMVPDDLESYIYQGDIPPSAITNETVVPNNV